MTNMASTVATRSENEENEEKERISKGKRRVQDSTLARIKIISETLPIEEEVADEALVISLEERVKVISSMDKAWHIGGGSFLPPAIPFSLLIEWTDKFSDEIGKGGFGTVYKGLYHDGKQAKSIAVKRMNKDDPENLKDTIKTFKAEINILSNVRHNNLIRLVGYYIPLETEKEQSFCLIYEYVERGDLAKLLKDDWSAKGLDWRSRMSIAYDIAKSLQHLHNRKDSEGNPILHRDIKAANIGITWNNKAKLLDLGLVKMKKLDTDLSLSQLSSTSTTKIDFAATSAYLDLEYLREHETYDVLCDIYSFGIVLAELFFGVIQGTKINNNKITILQKPQRMINERNPDDRAGDWGPDDCKKSIRNLISIAVDPDSEKIRPQSMDAIVDRLKRIVQTHCKVNIGESISLAERKEIEDELNLLKLSLKDDKKYSSSFGERECTDCKTKKDGISSCDVHYFCFSCLENEIQRQCNDDYRDYFFSHGKTIVCPYCLEKECLDIMCSITCIHNVKKFDIGFFAKNINNETLRLFIKANAKEDKIEIKILREGFDEKGAIDKIVKNDELNQLKSIEAKMKGYCNSSLSDEGERKLTPGIDIKSERDKVIAIYERLMKEIVLHFIPKEERDHYTENVEMIGGCTFILFKSDRMSNTIFDVARENNSQRNQF